MCYNSQCAAYGVVCATNFFKFNGLPCRCRESNVLDITITAFSQLFFGYTHYSSGFCRYGAAFPVTHSAYFAFWNGRFSKRDNITDGSFGKNREELPTNVLYKRSGVNEPIKSAQTFRVATNYFFYRIRNKV